VAIGKKYMRSRRKSIVIQTINHVTIQENHVFAPDLRFTAVLLKLQATHIHPNTLELTLAIHCQISSLFAHTLCFVCDQTNLATLIDSVNHISQIIIA
jgi:hypothetical protein